MNNTHIVRIIIDSHLCNFIFIVRDVIAYCPLPVFRSNGMCVYCKFHTFIFQCTYIGQQLVTEICSGGDSYRIQQILCFTIIEIQSTGNTSIQETVINTCIPSSSFFPLQILIICQWSNQTILSITEEVTCTSLTIHITW